MTYSARRLEAIAGHGLPHIWPQDGKWHFALGRGDWLDREMAGRWLAWLDDQREYRWGAW